MEIMLVEDSLLDARVTIEALKRCAIHHRLTLFRDGAEAIRFLHREGVFKHAPRPDLILLDLLLPDMTGVEFLRHVRDDEALAEIPVVVLTSSEAEADQEKCEALGVNSYIRKPFHEEKFLAVVRHVKELALALAAATVPSPSTPQQPPVTSSMPSFNLFGGASGSTE
ncbi:MAG: response regulator [Pirellulaceae bacterium]|nr:MAG: response regulator [Pirellulaceae bacterium]